LHKKKKEGKIMEEKGRRHSLTFMILDKIIAQGERPARIVSVRQWQVKEMEENYE
jgi:hypothetical protein